MSLTHSLIDRKTEYKEQYLVSTLDFEAQCKSLEHRKCSHCKIVSLQDIFKNDHVCASCFSSNSWTLNGDNILPVWRDHSETHYHVPEELSSLREGEKLLIQQISVYVPLHHLSYGQLGAKGHIVSFPQDINEVCTVLPRLPKDVTSIRVVKHFKLFDGEVTSKTFSIRKLKVMEALRWLQKYNLLYRDITICEENLDWIEDGVEQILPPTISEIILDESLANKRNEDRGPAEDQVASILENTCDVEPSYGRVCRVNAHIPKAKDAEVIETVNKAVEEGKKKSTGKSSVSIDFPYVSPEPISEFSERFLFEKAFPWLFPGGVGGYHTIMSPVPTLSVWMSKTLLYEDGRFSTDKMWSFCALNYLSRHMNQNSGSFFVQNFFKQGPETLEELQEKVSNGDLSWLHSIIYYSNKVVGSSSYWRARRNEVFVWINHHIEQGHGPPSFFITLSCAEYHWKDIERLIRDRCEKSGKPCPDFDNNRVSIINDHAVIVQEYFHRRVEIWLNTVGRDLLKIKHHWLCFEFAPSRGQIHAHMLAICDNLDMLTRCHELYEDKALLASYLSEWAQDTLGMTAMTNSVFVDELSNSDSVDHPSTKYFSDIPPEEREKDTTLCQMKMQQHKCSGYCLRKRAYVPKSESDEESKRRVCRSGAGVEGTYLQCDTPGFPILEEAVVVKDLRGFDRIDLPRNDCRVTQSSTYLLNG